MDVTHLRQLSEILGHKWDLVILGRLAQRPMRYMEIASHVREFNSEFSEGVLSKTLKRLAASGLLCQERTGRHHVWGLTTRGRYIMTNLEKIRDIDEETPPDEAESNGDR